MLLHSDKQRPFVSVKIAVMTVSDTRTPDTDTSGQFLADRLVAAGHVLIRHTIVPDNLEQVTSQLRSWIADPLVDVIITTGSTGITGRDIVPEAFYCVLEKKLDGFGELFRWLSYAEIGTSAIQSRATGGVANGTYLFAIPGSIDACRDAWDKILSQQLDSRQPCNLAQLIPRLKEH